MGRARRVKPKPAVVLEALNDVDQALKEIGELTAQLAEIDDAFNSEVNGLRQVRVAKITPRLERIRALERGMSTFAEYNKKELFLKRKSRRLVFGIVGFRKSTKIRISKFTLAKLKALGLRDAINVKETVNRDIMHGWPEEKLASVGAKKQNKDEFWYELKDEGLVESVAQRR